jgi:hypothetical protein
MATPQVAALLALMRSIDTKNGTITNKQPPQSYMRFLFDSAKPLGKTGPNYEYGNGRIDAVKTLDALATSKPAPAPAPTPPPPPVSAGSQLKAGLLTALSVLSLLIVNNF